MAGKLVHFEIAAADDSRAIEFYERRLRLEVPGLGRCRCELQGDRGRRRAGRCHLPDGRRRPGILVYFDTDDIDASIAKVREAGGQADDKQPIPHVGWFSHCTDTEGIAFGLFLERRVGARPRLSRS